MNGYICFHGDDQTEVYAETSHEAQELAVAIFQDKSRRKVRGHNITVILAERDGQMVSHNAGSLL